MLLVRCCGLSPTLTGVVYAELPKAVLCQTHKSSMMVCVYARSGTLLALSARRLVRVVMQALSRECMIPSRVTISIVCVHRQLASHLRWFACTPVATHKGPLYRRCGYAGVRVGEASHPGPPDTADLFRTPTPEPEAAGTPRALQPHAGCPPTQLDLPESFQPEDAAPSLQHQASETPLLAEQAPNRPRRTLTLVGGDAYQAAIEAAAAAMQEPDEQAEEPVEEEPTGWVAPRTWRQLDAVDLEAELRKPVRTVREPPRWFRGSLCRAFNIALKRWEMTPNASTWKLVVLLPRMLLRPTEELGEAGKEVFKGRMRQFLRGEWLELLEEAAAPTPTKAGTKTRTETDDVGAADQRRLQQAEAKIRMREVSRARVLLSSQGLAPGNANTLAELTDPKLRPQQLTQELPADAMGFVPVSPLALDPDKPCGQQAEGLPKICQEAGMSITECSSKTTPRGVCLLSSRRHLPGAMCRRRWHKRFAWGA